MLFPDMLEIRVTETAPPAHAQQDSAWKQAKLENGIEVMVPQCIKTNDTIRLDVENLKYMDRAKAATDKPSAIMALTYKGHGVSFLNDKDNWHGKPLSAEQLEKALAEHETVTAIITEKG